MANEFTVHRLNENGLLACEELAKEFSNLLAVVEGHIPAGRERSLVVTKLQEACFFAKRALALDSRNQV